MWSGGVRVDLLLSRRLVEPRRPVGRLVERRSIGSRRKSGCFCRWLQAPRSRCEQGSRCGPVELVAAGWLAELPVVRCLIELAAGSLVWLATRRLGELAFRWQKLFVAIRRLWCRLFRRLRGSAYGELFS